MGLKAEVDDISTVEAPFRPLYTEKDGKHVLTGVEDMVPKKDLAAVKTEAGGYRISLKKAEDKLKAFGDLDPVKVHDDLARIPELEALATGKIDDKKINDIVEQRITAKIAPVQRAHDLLKTENATLKDEVTGFKTRDKQRTIGDEIRVAGKKAGLRESAIEDAIMLGERVMEVDEAGKTVVKDKVGFTPGISAEEWFQEVLPRRPHWVEASQGGGANGNRGGGGGFGKNPWAAETWNMTEQGQIYRQDPKKAEAMAVAAGTKIGGAKPVPKTK